MNNNNDRIIYLLPNQMWAKKYFEYNGMKVEEVKLSPDEVELLKRRKDEQSRTKKSKKS